MEKKLPIFLYAIVFIAVFLLVSVLYNPQSNAPSGDSAGVTVKKSLGSFLIGGDRITTGCLTEMKSKPKISAADAEEYCRCLSDMSSMAVADAKGKGLADMAMGKSIDTSLEELEKEGLDSATEAQALKCQDIMRRIMGY